MQENIFEKKQLKMYCKAAKWISLKLIR